MHPVPADSRVARVPTKVTTGVSTLIREYIWAYGQVVGVFEGGQVYFVQSDHIGRPIFVTSDTVSLTFGEVLSPPPLAPKTRPVRPGRECPRR